MLIAQHSCYMPLPLLTDLFRTKVFLFKTIIRHYEQVLGFFDMISSMRAKSRHLEHPEHIGGQDQSNAISPKPGFTLVETMVGIALVSISGLVVTFMSGVMMNTSQVTETSYSCATIASNVMNKFVEQGFVPLNQIEWGGVIVNPPSI